MKTTSASLETFERQHLSADSGCWQHVQWPLRHSLARGRSRFRRGMGVIGHVRKMRAIRPGAELPLRPREAR